MRKVLFALAAIGGVMALVADLRAPQPAEAVTAQQLAQWIHDGKPGLRVIDHRSKTAFDWYHVPGAELASSSAGTIVVIADGRELELRGGMQAWLDMLQRPGALSRYFGGPPRRGGC